MVIMNRARYERLPEDLQQVIDTHSGMGMAMGIGEGLDSEELRLKAEFDASDDYTVVELEAAAREEMVAATAPVEANWLATAQADGHDGEALLATARAHLEA